MSTENAPEPTALALTAPEAGGAVPGNRFLFVVVASRRVVQLRNGARPRVDPGDHKHAVIAVAEVVAGCVSYTTA